MAGAANLPEDSGWGRAVGEEREERRESRMERWRTGQGEREEKERRDAWGEREKERTEKDRQTPETESLIHLEGPGGEPGKRREAVRGRRTGDRQGWGLWGRERTACRDRGKLRGDTDNRDQGQGHRSQERKRERGGRCMGAKEGEGGEAGPQGEEDTRCGWGAHSPPQPGHPPAVLLNIRRLSSTV